MFIGNFILKPLFQPAGRDGLTHNMLINFYNYWQRDSVIRVKCKGVATVDMDNVIFQIEVDYLISLLSL